MLNKYLAADPVPWLTDGENPAVTYLVKDEILNVQDKEKIYDELINSPLTDYFKKNCSQGILGDRKHPDVFYSGTVWFFLLAVESGYKSSMDFVSATADHICNSLQCTDGGFRFGSNPVYPVGCRAGNIVRALVKCGISGSRTDAGINWIVNNQRKDGGWLHCAVAGFCDVMKLVLFRKPGSGLKHEQDENFPSCPVATYACMNALIESDLKKYTESVSRGIDFFIRNRFFINAFNNLSCGNSINPGQIGYPVMSQYDFLSGLILASKTESWNDHVSGELFNIIIKKQNTDSSWNCENNLHGMIKEKHGKSRWTTLNALRLIKNIMKKENQ